MHEGMYVTLNISAASVRLLSIRGRKVEKWSDMPLPPGVVKDGLILRPRVVGAVIAALFKSTGLPRKRVIVSLTGLSFIHRTLTLPRMNRASLSEALRRAARNEMPLPPEELYLCGQAISNGRDEAGFFVLGVPRRPIDVLVQALGEAGIPSYLIDLNPLALARAANRGEAIIVNLEPDCFDIVLIADGLPNIMHTVTPRGERAALKDNIQLLVDELVKTVGFYNKNHPRSPLGSTTPLLVTGGLSANAAASELILAGAGRPVEFLVPPLELPDGFPAASFTANIGLALKRLPRKTAAKAGVAPFRDINVNVLSGKLGAETSWPRLPHVLLSLTILTGLVLLFPMSQLSRQADAETARLQAELTGVNQELSQARRLADEARKAEEAIATIAAGAETARQEYQYILSRGGDFAGYLGLVTGALPAGAFFTSVAMEASQINVAGEADDAFTVVDYVVALEALEEFAEVRIVSIDEGKSAGVSFKVVISKQA